MSEQLESMIRVLTHDVQSSMRNFHTATQILKDQPDRAPLVVDLLEASLEQLSALHKSIENLRLAKGDLKQ